MRIVICGAGEVGRHTAEALAGENSVTIVDLRMDLLHSIEDTMDVATLQGNCAHAEILREAGAARADLVVTATESDEINLLAASVAGRLGAGRTIARVHHRAYFEERGFQYCESLAIDSLFCPEYSTAVAIAGSLRNPGVQAIETFARGAIELQEFPVAESAPGVGRPLRDVVLPTGARVASVLRDHSAFIPDASTVLEMGDVIVLVGNSDVFQKACRLFRKDDVRRQHIVIMGGSSMGVWLCRTLRDPVFSIRLFEPDRQRAEDLAGKLDWVTVLCADATDPIVFAEEHIDQSDCFVALGEDDEHNILGCAWAKSKKVKEVIAVVQRPNYLHLLPHVGIDHAFSTRSVAVKEIEMLMERRPVRRVSTLADGIVDVYLARTGEKSEIIGKPLREIRLTPDLMIAAVPDGDKSRVPGPDDVLRQGDSVLLIGRPNMEKKLKKIFASG